MVVFTLTAVFTPPVHSLDRMSERQMEAVSGQAGITVDLTMDATVSALQYADADGTTSGAGEGQLIFNNLTLGDGSGNAASLTGLTLDADGGSNRVVLGSSGNNFTAQLDSICVDIISSSTDDCSLRPSFGQFSLSNVSFPSSSAEIGALGEGVTVDFTLESQIDHLRVDDTDGGPTDTTGALQIGNGNVVVDDIQTTSSGLFDSRGPASLSGLHLNADDSISVGAQTGGVVVGLPSGTTSFQTDAVYLGSTSLANAGQATLHDLNMNNSSVEISGH
jgi:hypothetical protein